MEAQWLRYVNEMRQTGGMAIFYGTMAILPVFVGLCDVTDIGIKWQGSENIFPPIALLIAFLTQIVFGITNIAVGLGWLLLDKGDKTCSLLNMIFTYASWYPFLTMIAAFIFMADKFPDTDMQPFIPTTFNPTEEQVDSIAAFETFGFIAYAANLIGALTFFSTKLFRMQSESGLTVYNRAYYNSRQMYYTFLTLLAGFTQLVLGFYVQDEFGDGRYGDPIGYGPFLVSYPEISIAMGFLIFFHGVILFLRSVGPHESRVQYVSHFEVWTFFVFLAAAGMQILAQVAVAPSTASISAINIFNVLGLAVMPTYLDIKACATPETVADDYYSTNPSYEKVVV
jgi:hypothetical protein